MQRDFCVDPSFIVLGFAADFPLQVTVVDEGRRRRDEAKKTVLSELSGLSKSRELSAVGLKHTRMRKTPTGKPLKNASLNPATITGDKGDFRKNLPRRAWHSHYLVTKIFTHPCLEKKMSATARSEKYV